MKKLISISIALALIVAFMAPVGVAADEGFPHDPGTYSKTPFGILGSVFTLLGDIVVGLADVIDGFGLPVTAAQIGGILGDVGTWTGVNLAWMTDMTGWSMVAVGDVFTVITPLAAEFDADGYIKPVADVFYVLGARILDKWDTILVEVMVDELPAPGLGLPVYTP